MITIARPAGSQLQRLQRFSQPKFAIATPRFRGPISSNQSQRSWYRRSIILMAPKFAPGSDESSMTQKTDALVQQYGWELDAEEMGLRKTFHFKTYTKALDFLNIIGVRSKSRSHHATMTIKPSSVEVHWTTHVPRGLSSKDIDMARYCEEQATEIGTVDKGQGQNCHTGKAT
ncbi:pterin-4-alpha-carbinolamine dehydratase family protein [Phyllosticta capitalensis]